jgi:predicted dehydrogenase
MTKNISRRNFLKNASAATALTAAPLFLPQSALGANDRINVAVIGVRGRGKSHISGFMEIDNVQVTTLCDPDKNVLADRAKAFQEKYGKKVKMEQDIRKVLKDKNIDAIGIATPNHWHSLATVWACQAGKDVYVEKPMSHNVWEGRKAVEAARKYKRIVQHGTQQRASVGRGKEIAAVQSGKYGKLLVSKGYCCKPRWSIGYKPFEKPPAHLAYDLWVGPSLDDRYHANLVHYNWHWFWHTGNGDIGNQGVHQMDVARWAIKGATLPKSVWSMGGRFGYDDQGETANTQLAIMAYDDVLLLFETRGLVGGKSKIERKVTNEYYTTEGKIHGGKFYPNNGSASEPLQEFETNVKPNGIFGNFIDAIRNRKVEDLNADVLEGHFSSALCHLPNVSMRLGQQVPFSKVPSEVMDNEVVFDAYQMIEKNLSYGLGLNLHNMTYQYGRKLTLDPDKESFVGDDEANAMLTRMYREPYTISETV